MACIKFLLHLTPLLLCVVMLCFLLRVWIAVVLGGSNQRQNPIVTNALQMKPMRCPGSRSREHT